MELSLKMTALYAVNQRQMVCVCTFCGFVSFLLHFRDYPVDRLRYRLHIFKTRLLRMGEMYRMYDTQ